MNISKINSRIFLNFKQAPKINPLFNKNKQLAFCANPIESDTFTRQTTLDITQLKSLDIKNFRLIDSTSARGECLAGKKHFPVLKALKEAGIDTIVDLRKEGSYDSRYSTNCERAGLNYFNFKVHENMPAFNKRIQTKLNKKEFDESVEEFSKELKQYFDIMDNDKVYMGCLLGLHRTDLAITLNYLLNPNEPKTPPTLSHRFISSEKNNTNRYINLVRTLLYNFTPEQREYLGISKEYGHTFDSRAAKLRMMNLCN